MMKFLPSNKSFVRKYLGAMFCASILAGSAFAQSNPAPQPLPYAQDFVTLTGSTPAYPVGWQGWTIPVAVSSAYPVLSPGTDKAIVVGANNSTAGNVYDFNGRLGFLSTSNATTGNHTVALAISTKDKTDIKVQYSAATQRVNSVRIMEMSLQYRVGISGNFLTVAGSEYANVLTGTGANTVGVLAKDLKLIEVNLPEAANDQEIVQLRWVVREISGSGDRVGFSIDDILIDGQAPVDDHCVIDLPYYEDFSGSTTNLPECTLSVNLNNDDGAWKISNASQEGFTKPFLRYNYSLVNDANDWFVTKGLRLKAGSTYRLKYKLSAGSFLMPEYVEKMKVMIGSDQKVSAMTTVLKDYPALKTLLNEDYEFTVDADGVYYIGFHAYSLKGMYNINLDDIEVKEVSECREPLAPFTSSVTSGSTANIQWTAALTIPANGYEYYYSTSETDPSVEVSPKGKVDADQLSALLTDLAKNTSYTWWVRSVCSATDYSEWVKGGNFSTPLTANSLGFKDDFETEINWRFANGTFINKWGIGSATNNGGQKSMYISNDGGLSNAYSNTASRTMAFTDITIPSGTTKVSMSFDWKSYGDANGNDYFFVWLVPSTFTPTAGQAISAVTNHVKLDQLGLVNAYSRWINHDIDVSKFAGTDLRVVFEWVNNAADLRNPPVSIDNFEFRALCDAQILTVEHAVACTNTTAMLKATATPGVTEYRWYSAEVGGELVATTSTGEYALENVTEDKKLFVTAFNGACESDLRTMVSVDVEDPITPIILTANKTSVTSCDDGFVTLSATGGFVPSKLFYNGFPTVESLTGWGAKNGNGSLSWFSSATNKAGGKQKGEVILTFRSNTGATVTTEWSFISPELSLPKDQTNLSLSFMTTMEVYGAIANNPRSFSLDVSKDAGLTWKKVWTKDSPATNVLEEKVKVDLSEFQAEEKIRLRFVYNGKGFSIDNWYIDDVLIASKNQQITWEPSADLYMDSELTTPYKQGEFATTLYAKPLVSSTYTVSAESGIGCEVTASIDVTVLLTDAPTGEDLQRSCETKTLADFVVVGEQIKWYKERVGGEELPLSTTVVSGTTYYASQTLNECESEERLAVKADACLSTNDLSKSEFNYYPNPVSDYVTLTGQIEMSSWTITNFTGQQLLSSVVKGHSSKIDVRSLKEGVYLLNVSFVNGNVKTFKLIKK